MSSAPLTVPPPLADDHEDVAWALRAASAQWRRDAHTDAVAWVERAAETAEEVGQIQRSIALIQLAEALRRGTRGPALPAAPVAAAPPLPAGAALAPPLLPPGALAPPPFPRPPPPPSARPVMNSFDVDVDVEEVDFVDDIEEVEDVEDRDGPSPSPPARRVGDEDTRMTDLPHFLAEMAAAQATPKSEPPPPRAAPARGGVSLGDLMGMMPEGDAPAVEFGEVDAGDDLFGDELYGDEKPFDPEAQVDEYPTDRTAFALPSSASSGPTERDMFGADVPDSREFGELDFADEAPTSRHSVEAPEPRITPPSYGAATAGMDMHLDLSSPAEVAMSRRSSQLGTDTDDIEQELGVNLSLDMNRPARPQAPPPARSQRPADQPPAPSGTGRSVGMASVRPSRPPGASDRIAHRGLEPFRPAPSASLPPVEPPSRPSQAPSPLAMREPEPELLAPPPLVQSEEEPSGAIPSAPPVQRIESSPYQEERPHSMRVRGTIVDGVNLLDVPGLQDLPEDAQSKLLASVRMLRLERGEEVASFGVALVTHGTVQLMPTIADAACALARKGEVIFTNGSLITGIQLRVVGFDPGSRVAIFSRQAFDAAVADCPWVADELVVVADRYQALAGAVMGPLGDSLDDMFRGMVLDKCTVKRPAPGQVIAKAGKSVDGLYIVGAGTIEILAADGSVAQVLAPGDFLFPETLLGGSPAPQNAQVGSKGALLLYANRMAAHELLATCPPFIELLAG